MLMTRRAFRRLVQQAMDELPQQVLSVLDNVSIVVESEPSEEQRERMRIAEHDSLYGLYEGVPLTQRTSYYGMVLPDKITLFQRPLEMDASSSEELLVQVKRTIVHEIAHHVGWNDKDIRRMGFG